MYDELREVWQELTAPGAPFEIREIELRGASIKTYATAPPSLRELWLATLPYADNEYLVYENDRWTYTSAHRDVAALGSWLRSQGVGTGDRVAIAMRNFPEWMLAYWAITSIGATVVGMNAWWVPAEMRYALEDCEPRVIILDRERLVRLQEDPTMAGDAVLVGVRLPEPVAGVVPWSETVATTAALPETTVDPDSDACIFYTSGTTGRPKGAQLTHRGCVSNVMSLAFWAAVQTRIAERQGLVEADAPPAPAAALITTPLFHVTANNCVAQGTTLRGGKLVHMYRWDAGEALKLIEAEKINTMSGVPVMARELITHPDFANTDTSSMLSLAGGGAQLQPDLVGKIDKAVANARPSTGYGMTETCGIITSVSGDFFVDKPESAGPAMPVFDVRIVDDNGNDVPAGGTGELWVKGAHVIRGYLNRPDATAETITDGWLHTGDIARLDEDNFIFIVDRKKDMVLRGGENVYCAEVEAAIFDHEAVAETSVFGVPDDRLGEEVGAAVVLKPGQHLEAEALRAHLASRLAKHKIPRYLWFRTEALPRNASGKFLKRELREQLDPGAAA